VAGDIVTVIGDGDTTVAIAVPTAEASARDVAVTFTVGGFGGVAGAV
jgi:hypothetical protein